MSEHTKDECHTYVEDGESYVDSKDSNICKCYYNSDAEYIVSLWNACRDIPNPEAIPKLVEVLKRMSRSGAHYVECKFNTDEGCDCFISESKNALKEARIE